MADGIPKAEIFAVFSDRVSQLSTDLAMSVADSMRGRAQRDWYIPKGWRGEDRDLLDIPQLHMPDFDRDLINRRYGQCVTETPKGTSGDIIALKLQMEYLAAEERAIRLRHATPVRCIIHGGVRRNGHMQSRVFPMVVSQVANAIRQGAGG